MRSRREHNDPIDPSSYRELQILSEVDRSPEVTQRQLSQRVGIALGLTNVLLRNLSQKGYVRVTKAGWKRWLYSLTPEGFSHKIRLTVGYVRRTLDDYQRVRQTLREQLEPLALNEESRIAICGTGEFAELVFLGIKEIGIEEIDIFGPTDSVNSKFLGMPVQNIETLQPTQYDRVVIALLSGSESTLTQLRDQGVPLDHLVAFFPDGMAGNGAEEAS